MTEANIALLTYNCGREAVKPAVFASHIQNTFKKDAIIHEILVLSLQEIAPVPYGFLGGRCLGYYYQKINEAIREAFNSHYVNIFTKNLGMTAIMVYVRREHNDSIGSVEAGATGVGWLEMGNKGAVGVKLSWRVSQGKYIDLKFIAAHLAPHEPAVQRRNQDWMHIVQRVVFEPVWMSSKRLESVQYEETDVLDTIPSPETQPLLAKNNKGLATNDSVGKVSTIYDPMSYVFVAGDLNYRVCNNHPKSEDHARYPKSSRDSELVEDLFTYDQLGIESKAGRTLHGFKEADVRFLPTYKYSNKKQREVGEVEKKDNAAQDMYLNDQELLLGYATHRWPSWCDRILYLLPFVEPSGAEASIKTNFYNSLPLMSTSDHQPVVASFTLKGLHRPLSTNDKRIAHLHDPRVQVPYLVDPTWQERHTVARRRELCFGLIAYLGLTWEGNLILLATTLGVIGGYVLSKGGL